MQVLQLFYSSDSEACMRTLRMLEDLVEQKDEDIVLMAHDVGTEEGREKAREFDVSTVPTTIVDGDRIIRGVPQSQEQVLEDR
ncbi:MAG: hypothetical protein MUP63_02525 [Candidatus Nanohaloarchaeota archaeon QJJ-7]|nr:hypothetical protein [Candidatus Nanohaloarchaeota archaeon QJJ-7]